MEENEYVLTMGSKERELTEATIPQTLSLPTLARLLFPAEMAVAPRKTVRFETPEAFRTEMIPKALRKDDIDLFLHAQNGMELHIEIAKQIDKWHSHGFRLKFTREHVKDGILDVPTLKQLIAEVAHLWRPFTPFGIRVMHAYIEPAKPYERRGGQGKVYHHVILELDWFTWFSPVALEVLGRERFEHLRTCYEKYELLGGIMVILQEESYDKRNPEHVQRRLQAEKELGFDLLPNEPGF